MTRTGATLGALCALLVAAASLADPTFFGSEWLLHDAFTRVIANHRKADPRIVIVAINEKSTASLQEDYGRPPYTRDVYAAVVRELTRSGAAVIAFDFQFPEPDNVHPDADREFAAALSQAPVVLAVDTRPTLPKDAGAFATKLWRISGEPSREIMGVKLPYFTTAPAIGTIRIASSPKTSVVHQDALADHVGADLYVPGLALEAARIFKRQPRIGAWKNGEFVFDQRAVPIDSDRTFAIRWSRFLDQEHVVDFDRLLSAALMRESGAANPKIDAFESKFRGRIVLIAYTAAGLLDLRPTPLSDRSAGVEIHANAVDNLINGTFNRRANLALIVAIMLLLAALLGALLHGMRSTTRAGLTAIAVVGLWILAGLLALAAGFMIPTVAGATSSALTYVVITVIRFTAEQRQTAVLRTTFGRYVSPQILEHVLAHPEKVQLGGERRDLTILFSDIRGFTSISEASEPEEVVEMLNEYLTRMVEILLEHGGTLDKFIGDAVMGFWNAPAPDPDHPRHAVACAIAMIEETARIRARWESEGKASIRIGIGINSGDAVVGNIGAEKVFGYTVIGDAVNLASRLEGKNKDYATEIIISEFTKARIGDDFITVYLDEVKVKGKELAVRIYEVKGRANA